MYLSGELWTLASFYARVLMRSSRPGTVPTSEPRTRSRVQIEGHRRRRASRGRVSAAFVASSASPDTVPA
jgi:hypothetical protein